jgi:hypothetical protein
VKNSERFRKGGKRKGNLKVIEKYRHENGT